MKNKAKYTLENGVYYMVDGKEKIPVDIDAPPAFRANVKKIAKEILSKEYVGADAIKELEEMIEIFGLGGVLKALKYALDRKDPAQEAAALPLTRLMQQLKIAQRKEFLDEIFPNWKSLMNKKPVGIVVEDGMKTPVYAIKKEDWNETIKRNPMLKNIKQRGETVFALVNSVGGPAAIRYYSHQVKKASKTAASEIEYKELPIEQKNFVKKLKAEKNVVQVFSGINGYIIMIKGMRFTKSDVKNMVSDKIFRWIEASAFVQNIISIGF